MIDLSESKLFNDKEKQSIGSSPAFAIFRLVSPDGDQGYPGTLLVEVLVGLLNPGQTTITTPKDEYGLGSIFFVYRAKIINEGKKIVTPVNLTQVRYYLVRILARTDLDVIYSLFVALGLQS